MGILRSLTQLVLSATLLAGTAFATRQEPVLQLHSDDVPTIVENADMDMGIHSENPQALNASASGFEVNELCLLFLSTTPRIFISFITCIALECQQSRR